MDNERGTLVRPGSSPWADKMSLPFLSEAWRNFADPILSSSSCLCDLRASPPGREAYLPPWTPGTGLASWMPSVSLWRSVFLFKSYWPPVRYRSLDMKGGRWICAPRTVAGHKSRFGHNLLFAFYGEAQSYEYAIFHVGRLRRSRSRQKASPTRLPLCLKPKS